MVTCVICSGLMVSALYSRSSGLSSSLFLESPRNFFGPAKLFLVIFILKTGGVVA